MFNRSNKLLYNFAEERIFLNFSKRIFLFYKTNPDPQMTDNFNGFVKKKKCYLEAWQKFIFVSEDFFKIFPKGIMGKSSKNMELIKKNNQYK